MRAAQPWTFVGRPRPDRRDAASSSACCGAGGRGSPGSTSCAGAASSAASRSSPSPARRCPTPSSPQLSTVPSATVTEAFRVPRATAARTTSAQLLRFVADTVLREGFGFDPPRRDPDPRRSGGRRPGDDRPAARRRRLLPGPPRGREHAVRRRPVRRHRGAGRRRGRGVVLLAAGRRRPARARPAARAGPRRAHHHRAGHRRRGGRCRRRRRAGRARRRRRGTPARSPRSTCPIIQAPSAGRSVGRVARRPAAGSVPTTPPPASPSPSSTAASSGPSSPSTRWSTTATSWATSVRAYRTVPDRVERLAGLAAALRPAAAHAAGRAAGRHRAVSAYPTKRSRLGNAVGLDTPASAMRLLARPARPPATPSTDVPAGGDDLMAALADGLTYEADVARRRPARPAAVGGLDAARYEAWFATLPADARERAGAGVGAGARARQRVHDGHLVFSGVDLGHVLVAIQPPRGYGDDPVAIYHSPNLPPAHHYLAFYRWLDEVWGADAIVHLGKHGTLEWLPGKTLALSAGCWPDAALGDVPVLLPVRGQRPGRGRPGQAPGPRRRHRPPPAADDAGRHLRRDWPSSSSCFDEYSQIQSLDPSKLPALRDRIWETLTDAAIDRDLGLAAAPDDDEFDDVIVRRRRLPVQPEGRPDPRRPPHPRATPRRATALIDLVLAITRLGHGAVPSLRATVAEPSSGSTSTTRPPSTPSRRRRRALVEARRPAGLAGGARRPAHRALDLRLARAQPAAGGRRDRQPPGRAGRAATCRPARAAPSPGAAPTCCRPAATSTPSTRRPCPRPLAWDVGLPAGRRPHRPPPRRGGHATRRPSGWCCGAPPLIRTQGDDVAEALALLGVRPVWEAESRRVVGLEPIPLAELGRPRIDVTLRISGFFRDAFPNLVAPARRRRRPWRRRSTSPPTTTWCGPTASTTRGSTGRRPAGYGVGHPGAALDQRSWRSDDDLAAVYVAWSGYSYGRGGYGVADEAAMRRRFAAIDVAVKNQDNREHDIFDSDDYLQDHGGMVATIRSLTGRGTEGVVRRLGRPGPAGGALAGRGGRPGRAHPGGEPAVDRGHGAPRVQGRLRDGGHRRLPVRLRRHRQRGRRLDVREGDGRLRRRPRRCASSSSSRTRGR